ncbi:hypothetical protein Dred_0921 [Desulforamulus reducens MI-1]|uniref:Uncharacterized protein n=1 Tax=Desulforamulus reducens (strain ATCC BAA-1160 / DSM 100696 / MI-1) TaxID=349161 RepID=A4J304_DESRM|nr:hypothetical protein [Desulforamulus reducens]ABO49457.1 hypothetical protein Dred_0921 [Desulforamulus reducens MI-1]
MQGYVSTKVKKALKVGERVSKRNFPFIKNNIIANSVEGTYEEAMTEWEFVGILDEENVERFVPRCQLCNQPGLRINFEIHNPDTRKRFLVGSSCIKKFLVLKGTSSLEESWDFFVRQSIRYASLDDLRYFANDVLASENIQVHQIRRLRKLVADVLGLPDQCSLNSAVFEKKEDWDGLVHYLIGSNDGSDQVWRKKLERIKMILFSPSKLIKKQKLLDTGEKDGHWANIGRKNTRVDTTLSRSEAYKNPAKKN